MPFLPGQGFSEQKLDKEESESKVAQCLQPPRLLCPWNSPGENPGVGGHALPQGIFPTQGSNPGLPHYRRILCHRSTKQAQEYWSGQPIPSPGDLPDPGIILESPALQLYSLAAELPMTPPLY